jgi:cation/acetate symporter
MIITGIPIPQIGFGSTIAGGADAGKYLLDTLNVICKDLGFTEYTSHSHGRGHGIMLNVFCITFALMVGTAGLPHVIIRFYTVPKARDARISARAGRFVFIAILYTTAPAVAAFARYNMINTMQQRVRQGPGWFKNWEKANLIAWVDKNGDGKIQYRAGAPFAGRPNRAPVKGNAGRAQGTPTS